MKRPLSLVLVVAGLLLPAPASHAALQESGTADADLRTENERLRTQVKDLERELAAAMARIAALEARVAGGSGIVSAPVPTGSSGPGGSPSGTDAALPTDNPAALLAEVQRDYATTFATVPSFTTSERDRTMYLRAVDRWVAAANRRYRARIEWPVRVVPDTLRSIERGRERGAVVMLQAIDPSTGAEIGDAFETFLPTAAVKRLDRERVQRAQADWRLRGTLIPAMQTNSERTEIGAFDRPRFIGPFAEFGFGVDANSLTEAREVEATHAPGASTPPTGSAAPPPPSAAPPEADPASSAGGK